MHQKRTREGLLPVQAGLWSRAPDAIFQGDRFFFPTRSFLETKSCFPYLLPLYGLWARGRVWHVAFSSLTHSRLTTVARLPDHSNSLLRVLLLE
jgi:hypothetical protein